MLKKIIYSEKNHRWTPCLGNQKNDLIEILDKPEIKNPYPRHKGCSMIRPNLTDKEKRRFLKNIRISDEGKIKIIKRGKSFSILNAEVNNEDIIDGNYIDNYGCKGVDGTIYFTLAAAQRESLRQNKELLDWYSAKIFISFFPGKNWDNKVYNFIRLFELKRSGCCYVENKFKNFETSWGTYPEYKWQGANKNGNVWLSCEKRIIKGFGEVISGGAMERGDDKLYDDDSEESIFPFFDGNIFEIDDKEGIPVDEYSNYPGPFSAQMFPSDPKCFMPVIVSESVNYN